MATTQMETDFDRMTRELLNNMKVMNFRKNWYNDNIMDEIFALMPHGDDCFMFQKWFFHSYIDIGIQKLIEANDIIDDHSLDCVERTWDNTEMQGRFFCFTVQDMSPANRTQWQTDKFSSNKAIMKKNDPLIDSFTPNNTELIEDVTAMEARAKYFKGIFRDVRVSTAIPAEKAAAIDIIAWVRSLEMQLKYACEFLGKAEAEYQNYLDIDGGGTGLTVRQKRRIARKSIRNDPVTLDKATFRAIDKDKIAAPDKPKAIRYNMEDLDALQ